MERTPTREEAVARLGSAFKGALGAVRRLRGRDTHRPGELSFAQYHLLFALAEREELSAGELALAADLSPATVTQLLDSLATMGLVERTRSDRDRRVVTCTLTTSPSWLACSATAVTITVGLTVQVKVALLPV